MSALGLALGIGIQNIREGSALSLPLRVEGRSRKSAFYYGAMSAIVESIAAVLGAYAVMSMTQLLPYALLFAAGAMIYVAVEELVPGAQEHKNTDIATSGVSIGGIENMSQCLTACNPDLIQGVHETEFDTVTLLNMSNFFKAISDPTRLRILQAVRQNPICVGDLAIALQMTKSAISHQLRYLRDCQLVKGEKKGRMTYYELADDHVAAVLSLTLKHLKEEKHEERV